MYSEEGLIEMALRLINRVATPNAASAIKKLTNYYQLEQLSTAQNAKLDKAELLRIDFFCDEVCQISN
jgi:hypothetical protein